MILDAVGARAPGSAVLVGPTRSWTAADMLAEIDELQVRLAGCRTLAVLADNSPEWVIADLAALRGGITHVPLPGFFSAPQLAHVLTQAGADTVLTDQPGRIAALGLGFEGTAIWRGFALMQRAATPANLPTATAKVCFTSGSSGTPKGACLSADGLLDTAMAVAKRLAELPIERHLATLPLPLLLENAAGIYAPLLRGAEIHLPGLQALGWRGMSGFDPAALQDAVHAAQPGSMILVPELLKAWTVYLAASRSQAPSSLAFVAVGGARVSAELIGQARVFGLPAYQGYGLTECGSVVSLNRPGDDADDVGRPLDHVTVRVEDGEIMIAARSFLGYLGEPAAHAGATAVFATGDLGRVDACGHLHLAGRRKNLLITSYGRNVAPEWVEACLLAQPVIAQAIVTGDARPWLSAVLVPAPQAEPAAIAAAIVRANEGLPDYARVRDWIMAAPFTLHNGQATGNGRPVRAAILNHYAAPLAALYQREDSADAIL